jgi:flagellar biosynthetic protein FliO
MKASPVGVGMIADLVLKLALVLVAAYASVWALKKFTQRRGRLLPARGSVRILETTSLAPNRGLHLVSVGSRVFMIGSTPESINLLGEVSEVAEVSQQLEAKSEKPSFGSQLQAMFRRTPSTSPGLPRAAAEELSRAEPAQGACQSDGSDRSDPSTTLRAGRSDGSDHGWQGAVASLRDGTFFMKRAAERARQLSQERAATQPFSASPRGAAVDYRG